MFHKEGFQIILGSFVLMAPIALGAEYGISNFYLQKGIQLVALALLILVLQFFRNPKRNTPIDDSLLYAPVDGKVVVIEDVFEKAREG